MFEYIEKKHRTIITIKENVNMLTVIAQSYIIVLKIFISKIMNMIDHVLKIRIPYVLVI